MIRQMMLILVCAFASIALFGCGSGGSPATPVPECANVLMGTPQAGTDVVPTKTDYAAAVKGLDMVAVQADMKALLVKSEPCWPADWGNYGPFMVRLAWHCSGTYRSDGLGGCGGGRQRFEPERSWPDNANLDKARALVYPLKEKYGDALSWGDLFVLAGTVAIRESGMPLTRMCFGREDQTDGTASLPLNVPCTPEVNGNCSDPYGATTVGLIYVNPEGPMGIPDPVGSVADIRRTFGTMGHSDRSTVALIGGGHAIGKTHGACPNGGGNPPNKAFEEETPIYKGTCGTGAGDDTFTSGFEGAWTTKPLEWDNEFFTELTANEWEVHEGPGGHNQWRIKGGTGDKKIMRLTSDMALLEDPAYRTLVDEFAGNMSAFNDAFDTAWYDLTTTNVGGAWSDEAKCDDGSKPLTMRADEGPQVMV